LKVLKQADMPVSVGKVPPDAHRSP
jgi:hypothetical protein